MPIPENVQYIRLPSPTSISLKAISEPESLISISPFSVNIMFISVRSIIHPTTSPDCHCLPKDSIPICQRWAWKRRHLNSRFWIADSLGFSRALPCLKAIEDIRQLICSKFCVGTNTRSCPANSHLSNCYSFKLKVPFPLCDSIRFLCSENSDFISPRAARSLCTCANTRNTSQIAYI